jgi:twitching motility protein PilT
MDLQVRWFCYLATADGVLTAAQCRELLTRCEEAADVLTVAEAALDTVGESGFEEVQQLVYASGRSSATGHAPPADLAAEQADWRSDVSAPQRVSRISADQPGRRAEVPSLAGLAAMADDAASDLLFDLLQAVGGSSQDLHLIAGARPLVRRGGRLERLGSASLSADDCDRAVALLLTPRDQVRLAEEGHVTTRVALRDGIGCRASAVRHCAGVGIAFRFIPAQPPVLAALGLPSTGTIARLLDHQNGLILVTGPANSGKTTTVAALINHLNSAREQHVLVIDDPVEYVFLEHRASITQRQIGRDTRSFGAALHGALREDPDVVALAELRDAGAADMGLTAAETGHLVIAAMRTPSAASTLNRLLTFFAPDEQPRARATLAENLRGIVCQRLLPTPAGEQVVAAEVLVNTLAVSSLIRDGKMHQLASTMETGGALGMCTLANAVEALLAAGRISETTAAATLASGPWDPAPSALTETQRKAGRWF